MLLFRILLRYNYFDNGFFIDWQTATTAAFECGFQQRFLQLSRGAGSGLGALIHPSLHLQRHHGGCQHEEAAICSREVDWYHH